MIICLKGNAMSDSPENGKKYSLAEAVSIGTVLGYLNYPVILTQLSAGKVIYEATKDVPAVDMGVIAAGVLAIATIVGSVYEAETLKLKDCSYNNFSNLAQQKWHTPWFSVAIGTAAGYAFTLSNPVDMYSVGTWAGGQDGGQWFYAYWLGRTLVGAAYCLATNKLIREGKMDLVANAATKIINIANKWENKIFSVPEPEDLERPWIRSKTFEERRDELRWRL
jgi:hypothetical protein